MKVYADIAHRRWLQVGLGLAILLAFGFTVVGRGRPAPRVDSYAACIEAGYPVLDTDPPICRDGSRSFTGPPAPALAAASPAASVQFQVLVDGDTHANQPAHRQDLINTPAQWQAFWREVHAGLATLPPLIPVDFTTSSVVAVSLGQQSTAGYGLKITNISRSSAGSTVAVTESTPTITCRVAQQFTNRYLIVRSDKLAEPVSFRITAEKRHCQ